MQAMFILVTPVKFSLLREAARTRYALMKFSIWFSPVAAMAAWFISLLPTSAAPAETVREIPDPLKPWAGWALWNERDLECPMPYHDSKQVLRLWPSRLTLDVTAEGAHFAFEVTVFSGTWVPLPGGGELWPGEVSANDAVVPVVEHDGKPAVKLVAGRYNLTGGYHWQGIPQRIAMPAEIGILSLTLDGQAVESPVWDAQGFLWLKRNAATEETGKDFLALKMNSLMEDGIPLWLHTDLELIVAGKSREESLGVVLPAGWQLASVDSQIPVAINDGGQMKAQVRAGKWTVQIAAFRLDPPTQITYAVGVKPATAEQLVAFRAQPDFRLIEISGLPSIDVSQTPFPDKWREFPVYRWDTAKPFQMNERMRGMGLQKPEGLSISRELWLDPDGSGLTFRDRITGQMQQVWRLDAAEGQDLGSVRAAGQGQLITRNPQNGALGVEIRDRSLELEATGRMTCAQELSATGWRTPADGLNVTLNLPPGWRLFALFGADWVAGDWLTAWTLLDLFLLLIFTLAVFRMSGFWAALLAFLAFGISYHEPGAPRYVWLVLLIPTCLLRVSTGEWAKKLLVAGKWLSALALVLVLVPFLGNQIQQCLYPQLENVSSSRTQLSPPKKHVDFMPSLGSVSSAPGRSESLSRASDADAYDKGLTKQLVQSRENLQYDTQARIQTGPGVPEWSWRTARFGWNGPVTSTQTVRPILIPMLAERAISMARVVLLLGLAAVLLNTRRIRGAVFRQRRTAATLAAALCCLGGSRATADIPENALLESLKSRLLEKSDAYPTAADIPQVKLSLWDRKLAMEVEIHTATRTAVPLPGRLPAWSPVTVKVDGQAEVTLRRDEGYLWVVLPAGVHRVTVEGLLANVTEWQWTYQLRPRRVAIDAPGWKVTGVRPGGLPEAQVFFTRVRQATGGEASYDRPNLQTAMGVDRQLELGLVWQVRTTVNRLSPVGNAVSLRVPLLAGEHVITSNAVMKDGFIEVRLAAQQKEFTWQSELATVPQIAFVTRPDDAWVERWSLIASPVWNVTISGQVPTFEASNRGLVPVWKPWPGESVSLQISRPEAVAGATVTVGRASHEITLGKRQRSSSLALSLRCSLGEDFLVEIPSGAEATSLTRNGTSIPVLKDGNQVIVPLKPGEQEVSLQWKSDLPLEFLARTESVRLPVECSNINTLVHVPDNRWVLWTQGPLRGPAVRFWGVLLGSLITAWVLGRFAHSPLRPREWMLLSLGLTQIPLPLALVVVGWLFFLSWRGRPSFLWLPSWTHNLLQLFLVALTIGVLGIFIAIVAEGLLGNPEMFIRGNDSTRTVLRWYEARSDGTLPQAGCFSISIWWYRLLMLLWALWLAVALIRWLLWGWRQFSMGGCFRSNSGKTGPPPLPQQPPNEPPPLPTARPLAAPILPPMPPL
jgi:hypothetical protein